MDYKYNYFYKITNMKNGDFYYGVHSTNDLNDGYMGSGKKLRMSYKEHGIKNFSKEILKFFDSRKELLEYERMVVNRDMILDPCCYNLCIGGVSDSNPCEFLFVYSRDDVDFKKRLKISRKEYNNNKDKYVLKHIGYAPYKDSSGNHFYLKNTDPLIKELNLVHIWTGLEHSLETREKIRCSQKNNYKSKNIRVWINNKKGVVKYVRESDLNKFLDEGWELGRKGYKPRKGRQGSIIKLD